MEQKEKAPLFAKGTEQKCTRLALLIDAENVSPRYADQIMETAQGHGKIVLKRAYAD